jgi:putative SOS response-associated peptidase YedK
MCGRYFRQSDKQRLVEAFHLGKLPEGFVLADDYNVAPTTFQPVIRADRETGTRTLVQMRWGLVPNYARSLDEFRGFSTINARAENILTSRMWRTPFARHRCLVPADGYYEWKKLDAKAKQPYAFTIAGRSPFAFAGLWDAWKEPGGGWLQSFSIVTTLPNELAATVCDRMPVILHPSDYDRWLDRDDDRPPIDLLRPCDADSMTSYAVDPRVGNVRNNEPALTQPYKSPPGTPGQAASQPDLGLLHSIQSTRPGVVPIMGTYTAESPESSAPSVRSYRMGEDVYPESPTLAPDP